MFSYNEVAVAGLRGILGKYLKSRGQSGAKEFLGEIIPTSANKFGTFKKKKWKYYTLFSIKSGDV
jgi:hypothetical protein